MPAKLPPKSVSKLTSGSVKLVKDRPLLSKEEIEFIGSISLKEVFANSDWKQYFIDDPFCIQR